MAINYRKIKSQIIPDKRGSRTFYLFKATPEQEADDIISISAWNKKQLINCVIQFTYNDEDWRGNRIETYSKHFKL